MKFGKPIEKIQHPVAEVRKLSGLRRIVPNSVSLKVGRALFVAKKNSPTILFVGGVAGAVGATVLACRATLKLESVLEENQNKMHEAEELHTTAPEKYSDHDYKHDMTYLYIQSVVEVAKLYGPALLLGSASIAALTGAHTILSKRNVALTAAYAAMERGLNEYRARVANEYGEDKERELYYGSESVTIDDPNDETGKKKLEVKRVDPNGHSPYARFFDKLNKHWKPTPEYNFLFVQCQQNYANDLLHSRGHIFLNEVYDALGMERTEAGQIVGWMLSPDSDNFVDFGVFNADNGKARDFVNGREGSILLDFNVDGPIYRNLAE
jgi:hypothetical protein